MQEYKIIMFTDEQEVTQEKYPLFFKYVLRDMQSVFDEFISNKQIQICLGAYACYMGLTTKKLPFERIASCLWSYIEFKPTHFIGGSQALSNALIDCFSEAGGKVKFNCGVKEIIIDNDAVKAVITEDGETITTKQIISNASPVDTYTKMLGEQDVPKHIIQEMNSREVSISAATVYLGLDCTAEELGISEPCSFLFDQDAGPDEMYGNPNKKPQACLLTCYSKVSPSFSPEGTCQLVIIDLQFGKPWLSISEKDYINVKNRYASQLIDLIEKFHPGIRENIEEVEVATPITHARYLSTPSGSIYGFSPHIKDSKIFRKNDKSIRGLSFAGAWVAGGGYEPSLSSGAMIGSAVARNFQKARQMS